MAFALTSSSFGPGDLIPVGHTVDGSGLSPPLEWSDVPRGTRSLALVVEDPDAPSAAGRGQPFVHWIVYNLQPSTSSVPLGAGGGGPDLPAGAFEGRNDGREIGYLPPQPPEGRHRYVFKLFALNATL